MTDLELINLASKASGFEYTANDNPLVSDALALRLAVKLQLSGLFPTGGFFVGYVDGDPYAATRRAIVLAAAEIGKEME